MNLESFQDGFVLRLSRSELIIIMESIGWIEVRIIDDQALREYVGGTRNEVVGLRNDISSLLRDFPDSKS